MSIRTIADIGDLLTSGFGSWAEHGHVRTKHHNIPGDVKANRKELAFWINSNAADMASCLFALHDEKPFRDLVFRKEFNL